MGQGTVECPRRQVYSIVPEEGQLYMGAPMRTVDHLSAWGAVVHYRPRAEAVVHYSACRESAH